MSNKSVFKRNNLFILTVIITTILLTITIVFDYTTLLYNKNFNEEYKNYSNKDEKLKIISKVPFDKILDKDTENILIMADSHNNEKAFASILKLIKEYNISLLVHLGDHTDYGSESEIVTSKILLDSLKIEYIVIPGDRDLAATGGDELFFNYFKRINTFSRKNYKFVLLNNSPNFTPLNKDYLNNFIKEINSADFILSSQPIYVEKGNIFESKFMGSMNKDYMLQRDLILEKIRNSTLKYVISGDHHRSSSFKDLKKETLQYYIVGATAEELSSNGLVIKQKSFQTQRVLIVSITKNDEILINEIEIFEE